MYAFDVQSGISASHRPLGTPQDSGSPQELEGRDEGTLRDEGSQRVLPEYKPDLDMGYKILVLMRSPADSASGPEVLRHTIRLRARPCATSVSS